MPRYKVYDYNQTKLIPVDYRKQILPRSFEHVLSHIVDHHIDVSVFGAVYRNDDAGAPAGDPAQDRALRLFPRHYQQPPDRPGL